MAGDVIRADYEALQQIATRFANQAETNKADLQKVRQAMDQLRNEGWVGRGSEAFFAEMDDVVLPGAQRLIQTLEEASRVTHQLAHVVQQAEEEASKLFKGEGEPGSARGSRGAAGGLGGALGGGMFGTVMGPRGGLGSIFGAGGLGGGLGGAFGPGGFNPMAGGNPLQQLMNQRGFPGGPGGIFSGLGGLGGGFGAGGSPSPIPVPYPTGIASGTVMGPSGLGLEGSSLSGFMGQNFNDHGIPHDWLGGVRQAFGLEGAGLNVPDDWLSGVRDAFGGDSGSGAGGAQSPLGSEIPGGSGGGASGGGGGGLPPDSELPTEPETTPSGGGGSGGGSGFSPPTSYAGGRPNYPQGTVLAADSVPGGGGEGAPPRVAFQSAGGGGAAPSNAPTPATASTAPRAGGGGAAPAAQGSGGGGAIPFGIALASPFAAIMGKLIKDQSNDRN